ncbi:hypothetical protein ANCDUO_14642 [Ancylostoma duodenale]|uniref:Uncharacterized protein n=1 Tax=Ancylostoma duodenale TaxID=51022 RepID=A0A0C2G8L6_9BILA|nr:hypothetical protein ANCDUO_14642 [Ancylostoma duodenale]
MLTKYPPHFEYFGQVEALQKEILDRASGDKGDNDKLSVEMSKENLGDECKTTENLNRNDAVELLPTYTPLETLENGAVRRKRRILRTQRKRGVLEKLSLSSLFFLSRILYFAGEF